METVTNCCYMYMLETNVIFLLGLSYIHLFNKNRKLNNYIFVHYWLFSTYLTNIYCIY